MRSPSIQNLIKTQKITLLDRVVFLLLIILWEHFDFYQTNKKLDYKCAIWYNLKVRRKILLVSKRIRDIKKSLKKSAKQHSYEMNEEGQAVINVGAENYDDIFSP